MVNSKTLFWVSEPAGWGQEMKDSSRWEPVFKRLHGEQIFVKRESLLGLYTTPSLSISTAMNRENRPLDTDGTVEFEN